MGITCKKYWIFLRTASIYCSVRIDLTEEKSKKFVLPLFIEGGWWDLFVGLTQTSPKGTLARFYRWNPQVIYRRWSLDLPAMIHKPQDLLWVIAFRKGFLAYIAIKCSLSRSLATRCVQTLLFKFVDLAFMHLTANEFYRAIFSYSLHIQQIHKNYRFTNLIGKVIF